MEGEWTEVNRIVLVTAQSQDNLTVPSTLKGMLNKTFAAEIFSPMESLGAEIA